MNEITKEQWEKKTEQIIGEYLSRNDGCFDAEMHARLCGYDFSEKSMSVEFETLPWQINERGGIHGGAIAGMFDTAFGVVANCTSILGGGNEAATADMNISFLRPVEYGEHTIVKVYVVKKGRTMIRLRAEMFCKESGKLVATGVGSWIPL